MLFYFYTNFKGFFWKPSYPPAQQQDHSPFNFPIKLLLLFNTERESFDHETSFYYWFGFSLSFSFSFSLSPSLYLSIASTSYLTLSKTLSLSLISFLFSLYINPPYILSFSLTSCDLKLSHYPLSYAYICLHKTCFNMHSKINPLLFWTICYTSKTEKRTIFKNIQNLGSWDNYAFHLLRFLSIEGVSMSLKFSLVPVFDKVAFRQRNSYSKYR